MAELRAMNTQRSRSLNQGAERGRMTAENAKKYLSDPRWMPPRDNVFSSLVGLRFIWQLSPIRSEESVTPHKLAHVPLTNTPLSDYGGFCSDIITRIDLEEAGHRSDLFIVQGTDIGQESVYVHLAEPGLEHLSDKIVLTIAEAMSLKPHSPVLVIMDTQLSYTLKILRRNKHEGHGITMIYCLFYQNIMRQVNARPVSLAPYSGRRTTTVHAFDIHSGQVIRYEVFVDKISRIQIFHHSVKLDLDGLATLRIHAFDAEGLPLNEQTM